MTERSRSGEVEREDEESVKHHPPGQTILDDVTDQRELVFGSIKIRALRLNGKQGYKASKGEPLFAPVAWCTRHW
jgi:hypothetical protein